MKNTFPVMTSHCKTCPFKPDSLYSDRPSNPSLANKIISQNELSSSHPCHAPQLDGEDTTHFCRGHRNEMLKRLHQLGWIVTSTDEAFSAMQNVQIQKDNETVWFNGPTGLLGRFNRRMFDVHNIHGSCSNCSTVHDLSSDWSRFKDAMRSVHKIVVFDEEIPQNLREETLNGLVRLSDIAFSEMM